MNKKEIRSFEFEVRAHENEEHGHFLEGRPIVFNARTDMGWYEETIDTGALNDTDLRDVRFLVNHNTDMIPLARSRNNNANSTMQLTPDEEGMAIRVDLDTAYSLHDHADTERFWKVEGTKVYFYLYVGFIGEGEGWMLHFDLVSGNSSAGCGTSTKYNGETAYTIGEATYKIYSDSSKSGEENFWGCLGVYREGTATA